MRKLTALFIASTLALGSASAAFAADTTAPAPDAAPMKMMHHKGEGKGGPFAGLNLTEQQRQQMRDIMKESHQKRGPGMKEERRRCIIWWLPTALTKRRRKRKLTRWAKRNPNACWNAPKRKIKCITC